MEMSSKWNKKRLEDELRFWGESKLLASSRCETGEDRMELDGAREGKSNSARDGVDDAGEAAKRGLLEAPEA